MAKSFEIDMGTLKTCLDTYNTELEEMKLIFQTLKTGIETLRDSDWKSDASTQYFSMYDNTWSSKMDDQIKIIEEMVYLLQDAKNTYDRINDEVSTVKM